MMNKQPETLDLLTVQQAAAFLNVSPGTIRRWAYHAQLSGRKIGLRGDWRFTKAELNALGKPNSVSSRVALRAAHSAVDASSSTDKPSAHSHIVQFYDDDAYLLKSVTQFIESADAAIVIATPEHRETLERNLSMDGKNLLRARQEGTYIALDAQETLSKFMVNDSPDPKRFFDLIGDVVNSVSGKGRVHAFGEMVALLWKEGNPEGALRLEELWNDLQTQTDFALFCAYPMQAFAGAAQMSRFRQVCDTHGTVTPSDSYVKLETEESRSREIAILQQKAKSFEAEQFFSKIAGSIPGMVAAYNIHTGTYFYVSEMSEKLLGYAPSDFLSGGTAFAFTLVHPEDTPRITAENTQALEAANRGELLGIAEFEYRMRHKNGSWRWIHTDASVFTRGADGSVESVLNVSRDITARKKIEDSLIKKDEFLAILAHELRNPLAPISSAVQILQLQETMSQDGTWAIDVIQRQLNHMTRLIDDLLDISRITSDKLELRKEKVDLNTILQAAVETVKPLIEEARHRLITSFSQNTIFIEGDAVRLAQIISNLLSNAAKYTRSGGTIWLETQEKDGEALITVRDNGIGISQEILPRIFDMFAQGERSPHSISGLGIGLTLVKRLIELHGGTIQAQSEGANRGSVFTARLPTIIDNTHPRGLSVDNVAHVQTSLRILVVDDNADALESMELALRLQGNQTHIARDGLEAVKAAEEFVPDVILLDIGMPVTDGYTAAKLIRAQPWGRKLKIVAVTGWGQATDKKRAKDAGFDHHLTKPVDQSALSDFLASVRKVRK